MNEEGRDDGELGDAQRLLVEQLTPDRVEEIDRVLLSFVPQSWRKVARVVAETMLSLDDERMRGIPDVYYAERIRVLASTGVIEATGNLRRMRFSEVRRRPGATSNKNS